MWAGRFWAACMCEGQPEAALRSSQNDFLEIKLSMRHVRPSVVDLGQLLGSPIPLFSIPQPSHTHTLSRWQPPRLSFFSGA